MNTPKKQRRDHVAVWLNNSEERPSRWVVVLDDDRTPRVAEPADLKRFDDKAEALSFGRKLADRTSREFRDET